MLERFFKKTEKEAPHISTGKQGEKWAAAYLKKLGYKILEQNWRSHPCELDIICLHEKEIVFVEVKSRSSNDPQAALSAFHNDKQNNIIKAAKSYLTATDNWDKSCRFDLLCISGENKNVEHFKNVIELQDDGTNRRKRNSAHSSDTSWQPW